MNAFIQQLFLLSITGTLSILLILTFKKLYQNHFSRQWQYYIWLVAALRFLVPFAPDVRAVGVLIGSARIQAVQQTMFYPQGNSLPADSSQSPSANTQADRSFSSADKPANRLPEPSVSLSADSQPSADRPQTAGGRFRLPLSRNVATGIFILWLLPALFLFARKIIAYRSFLRGIRSSDATVSDIRLLNLLGACEEACGVKRPLELYQIPQLSSPVMAGWLHPCIAIPDSPLSDTQLSLIFMHELTHYKRCDLIYKWLVQTIVCIHWYNPFVYLLEKEINDACELSCDEAVVRALPEEGKKAYGDTLLMCSKTAYLKKSSVPSPTLTEGGKQLKERLGAIMKYRQLTKKTKIATILFTAGICFGSAVPGAYATPARPVSRVQNDAKNPEETPADSLSKDPYSKYQKLLAFRTDSYQNLTAAQFREIVTLALDTPEGIRLLDEAFRDANAQFHRFDHEDAFFLQNTLRLASGSWRKSSLSAAGVERPLKNGQTAGLDFRAQITLLHTDIHVSEYEDAYRGLADTAAAFLAAQSDAVLADRSPKTTKRLSKEAKKAMQTYAKDISKKGNLSLTVDWCCYAPEDDSTAGSETGAQDNTAYAALPAKLKKLLTLKVKGYQNYTLSEFFDYMTEQYEADSDLWKASQSRAALLTDTDAIQRLSPEDYAFLTVTIPCTMSESTYERDRVGRLPAGFGGQFDLPYPRHRTRIHFEWYVQYEIQNPQLTVGERDQLILNVIRGMDEFVKTTPDTTDIGSESYIKNMRRHLKELIKETNGFGLKMTLAQCQ